MAIKPTNQKTLREINLEISGSKPKNKRVCKNKYNARACFRDGIRFASKKERKYYDDLKIKKIAGDVIKFDLQVPFPFFRRDGKKIGTYIADFVVIYPAGYREVVDVKGWKSKKNAAYREFLLKKEFVEYQYGLEITVP